MKATGRAGGVGGGRKHLLPFALLLLSALLLSSLTVWGQTPAPTAAAGAKAAEGTGDIELVEKLLAARREYQRSLERLRVYYLQAGSIEKARWAEEELLQYHRILKQAYRLDLDVPPPTLQGNQNVPAANRIYQRAMEFKNRGGWGTDAIDNQRRAELLFQRILSQYPQCDKISDTAYRLGEIYEGKSYKQYRRAAMYYERCFQWNPQTHFDARTRAARIYDTNLLERGRAIELYRDVINHETDPKRIQDAQTRLGELSGSR